MTLEQKQISHLKLCSYWYLLRYITMIHTDNTMTTGLNTGSFLTLGHPSRLRDLDFHHHTKQRHLSGRQQWDALVTPPIVEKYGFGMKSLKGNG